VIEAARPVDAAFHTADRNRAVDYVKNVVVFQIADVDNIGFTEFAEVVWLTSGRGVELCLVKQYTPTGGFEAGERVGQWLATEDLGGKVVLKSVVIVKAAGRHGFGESNIACSSHLHHSGQRSTRFATVNRLKY